MEAARTQQDERAEERYRYRLLAIVLTATLFSVMNSSMVNVALPTLMHDFGIGISTSVWLYTGYTLPYAVSMPILGVVGERIGAKNAFIGGVIAFLLASLLCSMAWNFPSLLLFRVLQAIGAAAVMPNAMVIITGAFPSHRRGQALGIWSAVSGVGAGVGPALGGFLTQHASWHAIFWVNAPFLLAVILVGRRQLRDSARPLRQRQFDLIGAGLLAAGLSALMLALTAGQIDGWTTGKTLGLFAVAIIGLVAFLWWEFRVPEAILPINLFRTRSYSAAVVTIFLQSMVLFGVLLLFPIYLQSARGYTPTEAGFMILPLSAAMIAFAPMGGRISDRLGPRLPATVGMVVVTVAMAGLSRLTLNSPYWQFAGTLILIGTGLGLSISPLTSTAMNSASPEQRGAASGFFNTLRFVGAVLGSTILTVILSDRTQAALPHRRSLIPQQAYETALIQAFHDVYLIGAVLAAASALAALTLRPGVAALRPVQAGPESTLDEEGGGLDRSTGALGTSAPPS